MHASCRCHVNYRVGLFVRVPERLSLPAFLGRIRCSFRGVFTVYKKGLALRSAEAPWNGRLAPYSSVFFSNLRASYLLVWVSLLGNCPKVRTPQSTLHFSRQRASMGLFGCRQSRLLRARRQTAQRGNREQNGRSKATAKRIEVARN